VCRGGRAFFQRIAAASVREKGRRGGFPELGVAEPVGWRHAHQPVLHVYSCLAGAHHDPPGSVRRFEQSRRRFLAGARHISSIHQPFAAATTSKLLLVVAVEGKSEKESRAWWWSLLERLSVNQMTRLSLAWPVHLLRRGASPRSSGRRHPVPPHTYRMHRSLIEC
jgi:hypothetical protein